MSTILVLKSSVLGEGSASNQLIEQAVDLIRIQDPTVRVLTRDLAADPIPHLTPPGPWCRPGRRRTGSGAARGDGGREY